jgi:uncharacterized membrane protein
MLGSMAMAPDNPPSRDRADIATETRLVRVEAGVEHLQQSVREMRQDIRDVRGEMKDLRGDMKDMRGDINDLRKQQREDFRLLFAAIIATNLGLGSLMAKGFGWL